jgi:hypothetical protein
MIYKMSILIIGVYHIDIEANSAAEAYDNIEALSTDEIREQGKMISVETDYAEILGEEDES